MKIRNSMLNIIFSMLGFLISIVLSFVLPRMFINSFGSEMNGLLSSVNQIFIYISLFEAGIGIATIQALYSPIVNQNREGINSILAATKKYYTKAGFYYLITLIIFSFSYTFFLNTTINKYIVAGIILLTGTGNVINFFAQGKFKVLLQAEGKSYIVTNILTIIQIVTSLSKIIMIYMGYGILAIQTAYFLLNIVQMLFFILYMKKNYTWLDFEVEPNYNAISQKKSVFVHQVSSLIFLNTDIIILTFVCGLKTVSIYTMYKLVITIITTILYNVVNSVIFAFGHIFSLDFKRYCRIIDIFDTYYIALGFSLFTITYLLLIPFMRIYTANIADINYIYPLLPAFFIIPELLNICRCGMLNTINIAGHFKKTQIRSIIESMINIILSLIFVKKFGIYGVLTGTTIALMYRTNDIILYTNKFILLRSPGKLYKKILVNILLMVSIIFVVNKCNIVFDSYVSLVIIAIAMSLTIIPLFLTISSIIQYDEFKIVKNKLLQLIIAYLGKYKRV